MQRMSALVRYCCHMCVRGLVRSLAAATTQPFNQPNQTNNIFIFIYTKPSNQYQVEDGVVKKLHLEGGGGLSTSGAETLLGEL